MEEKTIRNEQAIKNASVKKMSPHERSAANPRSAKLAIAAFCYHTCHKQQESNSHNTKRTVKNCNVTTCPLWPHRGWQKIGDGVAGRQNKP